MDNSTSYVSSDLLTTVLISSIRPLILFVVALIFYNLPTFLYKTRLTIQGLQYLLVCNDKSWKSLPDPAPVFDSASKNRSKVEKKTIVFIRHGESTWNETFNKGSHRSLAVFVIGFIPNLIKAVLFEFYLLVTGKMDSWFYDAPLSDLGFGQVNELGQFLSQKPIDTTSQEKKILSIIRGDPGTKSSQLYSSNLRRALSTMVAAFNERLDRRPTDKISILPCLQEISRNPDTLSITPPHEIVSASWIEEASSICDFSAIYQKRCDMSLHTGNKPMDTNGLKRMLEFCNFAFEQKDAEVLICGGHSIWFRSFFRSFLPYAESHVSKTRKIVNAGTVSFDLMKTEKDGGPVYMIDPKSIFVVYGGF